MCIWDNAEVPMKPVSAEPATHFHIEDESLNMEFDRIKRILDTKYEPADLDELTQNATHLSLEQRHQLNTILKRHQGLFDGTLGKWTGAPYKIDLKPDVEPYHARPHPLPRVHEQTLKSEVERLCKVGALRKINRSEWAAPSFIIPKKDGTVRFITDFRELNKRIRRKPHPMPKKMVANLF